MADQRYQRFLVIEKRGEPAKLVPVDEWPPGCEHPAEWPRLQVRRPDTGPERADTDFDVFGDRK